MNPGLIGGIVGSVLGVLGGVLGTYASIRNTSSPPERRYVIRYAIGLWIGAALFLAGVLLLPPPYNWLLWIPYALALPLVIRACNRGQARTRAAYEAPNEPKTL